jgi:hypothetical protein
MHCNKPYGFKYEFAAQIYIWRQRLKLGSAQLTCLDDGVLLKAVCLPPSEFFTPLLNITPNLLKLLIYLD